MKWAPGATSGNLIAYDNTMRPLDVTVDCNGNVYVADFQNNRILKYPPGSGTGTTIAGGNGQGFGANQLYNPVGIFIVGNNNLYVADFSNHRVQRFSNSIDPRISPTVPGKYTVTVDYPCCASYSETIEVFSRQQPDVSITSTDQKICTGKEVVFEALNNNNIFAPAYQWLINGKRSGDNTFQYKSSSLSDGDKVQCVLTSTSGCTVPATDTSDIIAINVISPVPFSLGNDMGICPGTNILLTAPPNYSSYRWQDNSVQPTFQVTSKGRYYLTMTNECNHPVSDTINISMFDLATSILSKDTVICSYDKMILSSKTSLKNYLWSNQSSESSITINQPGQYWLLGHDSNNCVVSDTIYIQTKTCPPKGFYIPNAFSPNKDNVNDVFKPVIYGTVKNYKFSVYNRYGYLVFSSPEPGKGWDGTQNGKKPGTGLHVWLCTYETEGNQSRTERGTVLVIR